MKKYRTFKHKLSKAQFDEVGVTKTLGGFMNSTRGASPCLRNCKANASSLGNKPFLFAAGMDFRFETVECGAQCGWNGRRGGHDLGEFGPEQPGVGPGKEQCNAESIGGELIAMTARNALDDAVESQSAKVVRHFPDGIIGWIEAQQLRQQDAHL